MTRGERKAVRVKPGYGFAHPDCRLDPPGGAPPGEALVFELTLLDWVPADKVWGWVGGWRGGWGRVGVWVGGCDATTTARPCPFPPSRPLPPAHAPPPSPLSPKVRSTGENDELLKISLVESEHWEMARAPNEVTFTLRARAPGPAGDTGGGGGSRGAYFTPPGPLTVSLGSDALPQGLEAALGVMSQGETAAVIVPARLMAAAAAGGSLAGMPPPPAGLEQVELRIELQQLVQVRRSSATARHTCLRPPRQQANTPHCACGDASPCQAIR